MTLATVANTRAAQRSGLIEELRVALTARQVAIEGGALDGVEVVSEGHIREALDEILAGELPELDDRTAEVRTPATVLVEAECPRCHIAQEIDVELGAVLTTDSKSSSLKLRAKATARIHICGQMRMVGASDEVDGQEEAFELEDITGGETEPVADETRVGDMADPTFPDIRDEVEVCPHPHCILPGDHSGQHELAKATGPADDEDPTSGDLLP
jgi:hypothetical protein